MLGLKLDYQQVCTTTWMNFSLTTI